MGREKEKGASSPGQCVSVNLRGGASNETLRAGVYLFGSLV